VLADSDVSAISEATLLAFSSNESTVSVLAVDSEPSTASVFSLVVSEPSVARPSKRFVSFSKVV